MNVAYYPGCLLSAGAREYDRSLRECARLLGDTLIEIDWVCCGGVSFAALAPEEGRRRAEAVYDGARAADADRLLVPCPYCMDNLTQASSRPPVEILSTSAYFALERRGAKVEQADREALQGLRAALFPGCRAAGAEGRPTEQAKTLLEKLGVEWVKWNPWELCCGGWRAESDGKGALDSIAAVLAAARDAGADAIVTVCPVCQLNLDSRQAEAEQTLGRALDMPIFFFSELVGFALGSRQTSGWFGRHITSPWPLVERLLELSQEEVSHGGQER